MCGRLGLGWQRCIRAFAHWGENQSALLVTEFLKFLIIAGSDCAQMMQSSAELVWTQLLKQIRQPPQLIRIGQW